MRAARARHAATIRSEGSTRSAPGCCGHGSPQAPTGMTQATAAPAPASQHPARPGMAALRLKPASARTRPDSSKDIQPFIAKITCENGCDLQ
jgi:hypothetical protein